MGGVPKDCYGSEIIAWFTWMTCGLLGEPFACRYFDEVHPHASRRSPGRIENSIQTYLNNYFSLWRIYMAIIELLDENFYEKNPLFTSTNMIIEFVKPLRKFKLSYFTFDRHYK